MKTIANRIATKNNNFLVKIEKENKTYVFYVDANNNLLKTADLTEWNWAAETWGSEFSIIQKIDMCDDFQKIIDEIPNYQEILKTGIALHVKTEGYDELWGLRNQLDNFVCENFQLLWKGACRLSCAIDEDYYAPCRIQINDTRLHARVGLKYASGHKYDSDYSPSEQEIIETVADIQELIDSAAENITTSLKIEIRTMS